MQITRYLAAFKLFFQQRLIKNFFRKSNFFHNIRVYKSRKTIGDAASKTKSI